MECEKQFKNIFRVAILMFGGIKYFPVSDPVSTWRLSTEKTTSSVFCCEAGYWQKGSDTFSNC